MEPKKVKWLWVAMATVGFFLFIAFVLTRVSAYTTRAIGDYASPDSSFFYSASDMYAMAKDYGPSGRRTYIFLRWTFDVVWPFVYTGFLVLWTMKLASFIKGKPWVKSLYWLPIMAMILDFIENIGATIVMVRYPATVGIIAHFTPIATVLKWTTLSASFGLIVLLGLIIIYQRLIKKT